MNTELLSRRDFLRRVSKTALVVAGLSTLTGCSPKDEKDLKNLWNVATTESDPITYAADSNGQYVPNQPIFDTGITPESFLIKTVAPVVVIPLAIITLLGKLQEAAGNVKQKFQR